MGGWVGGWPGGWVAGWVAGSAGYKAISASTGAGAVAELGKKIISLPTRNIWLLPSLATAQARAQLRLR